MFLHRQAAAEPALGLADLLRGLRAAVGVQAQDPQRAHVEARTVVVERRAVADLERAGAVLDRWSAGGPAVLGGDTNVREPQVPRYTDCGGHVLDHVFARGIECAGPATTLPRHDAGLDANLSDHRPVVAELRG